MVAVTDFALTHPEDLDDERLRAYEADFTPMPVVRQCLMYGAEFAGFHASPESVCDPAAGAGAWCAGMRERFVPESITAIELRPEERPHLERHADAVLIGDAIQYAESCSRHHAWDLVATNPPFSRFAEYADRFLRLCHDVWLFAPVDALVRGEQANKDLVGLSKYLHRVLWVPGALSFRENRQTDFRQYGLWMFRDEATDFNTWTVQLLPRLSGEALKWRTRPGTEVG